MAKNSTKAVNTIAVKNVTISSTSDFINDSSKEYAVYTAQNRAIPSVCDAMKDGQRKMLWLMRNKAEKVKTISLAGAGIQEGLVLHGDASASDAISRLAAPYLNNIPLFDGIGAFGTRVGPDSWGAPRYTYVKRSKAADALLYTDLDIVPLKPNYDGSVMEPENFLPLIPLVLLNGISGIAVGWSTDILPHKLNDIINATLATIDGKTFQIKPHFDYLNVDVKELSENSYEFSGKVKIESSTVVRVTELPPDLSLENFKSRLNSMEDDGSINTYVDRSTKFIDVEIRFKRGTIDCWTEQNAIDFLRLKSKSTQRLVVLDFNNKSIKQYETVQDLVKEFVKWRIGWYTVRYNKQIDDLTSDLNFAIAIRSCVQKKLPSLLSSSKNKAEVENYVKTFTSGIPLSDTQLDRIVGFPSYRWAKDSVESIIEEIPNIEKKINDLENLIKNPKKIVDIYRKEVSDLLKLKL